MRVFTLALLLYAVLVCKQGCGRVSLSLSVSFLHYLSVLSTCFFTCLRLSSCLFVSVCVRACVRACGEGSVPMQSRGAGAVSLSTPPVCLVFTEAENLTRQPGID